MRKTLTLLLALVLPTLAVAQPKPVAQSRPLVFTHVTVIDTAGGPARSDTTVVISGNRIIAFDHLDRAQVRTIRSVERAIHQSQSTFEVG